MPLFNKENNVFLNWSGYCVISDAPGAEKF